MFEAAPEVHGRSAVVAARVLVLSAFEQRRAEVAAELCVVRVGGRGCVELFDGLVEPSLGKIETTERMLRGRARFVAQR